MQNVNVQNPSTSSSLSPAGFDDALVLANRLAAIVENSTDAIVSKNLDGIVTSWNKGAEKIFGYSAQEMIGTSITRLIPSDRLQEEHHIIDRIKSGEIVEHFDTIRLTKSGREIYASVTVSPITDAKGVVIGASKIARDITASKIREREFARLSRLYKALSQANQAIVVSQTRDELLSKICQILCEQGGFEMAWIGWIQPDGLQLEPVAAWGDKYGYLDSIKIYVDDRPEGRGPAGTAFRENEYRVSNDVRIDPAIAPWCEAAARSGFVAFAALPICENKKVVATLNVYANEAGFFQTKEIELLSEAARDISFAIDSLAMYEDRKRAHQAVADEREFSSTMIECMPGILYFYNEQGQFLRWNENLEKVTGYTGAEIAQMNPLDFFAGDQKRLLKDRIAEVFETGNSYVEADFVSKDGSRHPYYFTGRRVVVNGEPCLVGMGIDVSERKRAELAQQESESRYRTLFKYAPDGILIGDNQSQYLDANDSVCEMLGYTREEVIGMHARDIIVENKQAEIDHAISLIHQKLDYFQELEFRRKDGSTFPAEVLATMMPDGNLMGMIRDISERKESERALKELNESLEQKVQTRTAELGAALARVEAADRLKSAFLATMSHELRTPLNSIIGFTGIVLQQLAGPLTAEQSKQLGMVRTSARHLLELINDVLDLSKIEAQQLEVYSEVFDLRASLDKVIGMVRPLAEKKDLELICEVPEQLGEWVSDRRRVEQILLNLLNNAIKFTDRGSVTLSVSMIEDYRLGGTEASRRAVRFEVKDTGIGVKKEDLRFLFQPFRQLDSGLSRKREGTGLGLAICRRLASLLEGDIKVTSEEFVGSIFTLTLPMRGKPQ